LRNDRAINEALQTLPSSIYSTDDEILYKLCSQRPDEINNIKTVLQWLVGSFVPLTLNELAEAIAIRPTDRRRDESGIATELLDVAAICGSLITLRRQDTSNGIYEDLRGDDITLVSLSHASVEEYLKSSKIGSGLPGEKGQMLRDTFHLDSPTLHTELARTCLQYVGFDDFEKPLVSRVCIYIPSNKKLTPSGGQWVTSFF
jgi:hypothetical protein